MPRIHFGAGARDALGEELERLDLGRVLILTTSGRAGVAAELVAACAPRIADVFHGARQHVPAATVELARRVAIGSGADGYVSLGGGAATGLAKALALESSLPIVALPTTLAGSEVTPVWGVTDGETKRTGRDDRVMPRVVIYDPELLRDLPPALAGASGLNAVAHCVEALYAPDANPLTSLLAEEGIRVLGESLPQLASAPDADEPRAAALYGAFLAGLTLAAVRMGPHHRLCHALGGAFDLPHAGTHAVLLPFVVARLEHAIRALERVATLLGGGTASEALRSLAVRSRAPRSLRELGMRNEDVERACELAEAASSGETLLSAADARAIVREAFTGSLPANHSSPPHAG
jgi:maleylacetate reductase